MIKAIFFDVDGTLISHTYNDIPASTLKALSALRKEGILLFLATGRHISELAHQPLHNFPFDGYITQTGQLCYDQDFNVLFADPISSRDTEKLTTIFSEKRIPLVLINREKLYINTVTDTVIITQASIDTPIPDIGEYTGEELFGATVFGTKEEIASVVSQLEGCKESSWHSLASDIILSDCGKVRGIEKMLHHFNLRQEEIMSFGDSNNDADMIKFAAIGVAMSNGTRAAIDAADYTTSSVDEEGVLKALLHFGLITQPDESVP